MFHLLECNNSYELYFSSCYVHVPVNDLSVKRSFLITNNLFGCKKLILNNKINSKEKCCIRFFKYIDKLFNGISIGGAVFTVIRFIKPFENHFIGVIVGWIACITTTYGIVKNVYYLYDRIQQQKTINPFKNNGSLFYWLSFGDSLFAAGATTGFFYLQNAAINAKHVGRLMCGVINVTIFGTAFINGIYLMDNAKNIMKKYINKNIITKIEIFQLASSAAFFMHSILQMKTANSIIKDAQKAKLSHIRQQLNDANQKINFDREIMLGRNEANFNGKSEIEGTKKTIKGLNKLFEIPSWKELFGKAVHPESSAAIHACQPTHLTTTNSDIILRENAIIKAQYSHKTRYNGERINQKSTNTILAIPPHLLDFKLSQEALSQSLTKGPVSLPGRYYGYEIKLGPEGIFKTDKFILVENPQFYFNGEMATHFFSKGGTIQYLDYLPENVKEIYVDLKHNNFNGLFFANLSVKTMNECFDRNDDSEVD